MAAGVRCTGCGQDNRAGRRFCGACGARLAAPCPACGAPNEPGERFCGDCGAPLGIPPEDGARVEKEPVPRTDPGVRKIVTIVFADLVGSTALHERLDAESARRLMERYYSALGAGVAAHGGTVVKLLGDGVMAAFGLKQVAEDDALRAVRAGAAMQEAFRVLRTQAAALGEVGLRVAVNTGEVVVGGAEDDVIGDPVNVAARLQEQGRDGDVVIGESTRRLVSTRVTLAPLGNLALKGRAEAVGAYRLLSLDPPAATAAVPFVGRDAELGRLATVYDLAATTPAARLAVLLGSPGLGKSRLMDELVRRYAETSTVLTAHCDAAGGATFAPLAKALRIFLGLDDAANTEAVRAAIAGVLPAATDEGERARIAGGVGALLGGAPTSPEETFFVVRRFLAGLASVRPIVLVIDDLHWAEPLLLDLIEHLIQWGRATPLFVLAGARPELRDLRPSLVTQGGLVADVVTLAGLDAGAAMRLAANVIGAVDLPAAVAAKVLATSEGNPLFVGELVRMLVQEGALTKEGERWTAGANLVALEMPPTIHAVLAARIERLRPEERAVLERASVVGRHFSRSAVAALLAQNGDDLDARLEALRRSELIERDTGWFLGEPVLRFHHVLIRDAAYRRLLKGTRAELHTCLADWIEAQAGDAPDHDETIGWHLEQAHRLLRELDPIDESGRTLGERAARRLALAGRRALARDDLALAASLLGRALACLDAADTARAELALDWCEALLSAGDVGPAANAIDELGRFTGDSERLHAWRTCFASQLTVLTEPQALQAAADAVAAAAETLTRLADSAGEAKAHSVHAQALARLGRVGACEAALDQALAAARRAGDRRRANAVLSGAPPAALWGPSPVTRASGRCLDVVRVLRITQGAPAVEAVALSCQGVLEALRGRTDAARRMIASSRKMVEELGIAHRLFEADVFAGRIDLLEGDALAAERNLRGAYDGLRELGLGIDAARAGALLARAQLAQGKVSEAEQTSRESEALAGDDLQAAIAWRGVRAEALARRGETTAAVELAQAAVAIATATDALLDHADARRALAAALRAAGLDAEAAAEDRHAMELWGAKGATLLVDGLVTPGEVLGAAEPEATARSDAPVASRTPAPTARRPARANAATENAERFGAAIVARDLDALAREVSEDIEVVHHQTGTTYGRKALLATWRSMFRAERMIRQQETLASLGDSLALAHHTISLAGFTEAHLASVGIVEIDEVVLFEVDEQGRDRRFDIIAIEKLGGAIVRLYERYAELLPDGPARERAAATARSIAAMVAPPDLGRYASALAPEVDFADHRTVGFASGRGAHKLLRGFGSLLELADDVTTRVDEILALEPDSVLLRWTTSGIDRASGGAFESPFLLLWKFGTDGLVVRDETFDVDRAAEALARFDELTDDPPRPFANAATRILERYTRVWARREWPDPADFFAPTCQFEDRRLLFRMRLSREAFLEQHRIFFEVPNGVWTYTPIATRGERLALTRVIFTGEVGGGGGTLEIDHLGVFEADGDGLAVAMVLFDLDERDAAYAELDARFASLEERG